MTKKVNKTDLLLTIKQQREELAAKDNFWSKLWLKMAEIEDTDQQKIFITQIAEMIKERS